MIEKREITGFGGYFVTSDGSVISVKTGSEKLLKISTHHTGYLQVSLQDSNKKGVSKRVHRLVAEAFLGRSELLVNHIDFNKRNNNISNLEYVTHSENMKWNKDNDRMLKGEENGNSKFDWAQILTIYTMFNHKSNIELADYLGTNHPDTITFIAKGKSWDWMHKFCPPRIDKRSKEFRNKTGRIPNVWNHKNPVSTSKVSGSFNISKWI